MATAKLQLSNTPDMLEELLVLATEKLQLSETQYELAKAHYEALGGWLDAMDSPLHQFHPRVYPQGSIRIGTTVKPWGAEEFDVDLVCELLIDLKSNPVAVLDLVQKRIESNGRYRNAVERKNRCVRVTYQHDFHLDVLPAVPDVSKPGSCVVVPDCKAHSWKPSNPEGYAKWFDRKSELFSSLMFDAERLPKQEQVRRKSVLKRVVQLKKRFRDIFLQKTPQLVTPSVVITTLAATHYCGEATVSEAMENILSKILTSLPPVGRLIVRNPMNLEEDFSEKWDQPGIYTAFLNSIQEMRNLWQQLRAARGVPNVAVVLKKLFGEDIGTSALEKYAQKYNHARDEGTLSIIGGGTGVITTATAPGARLIPKHTYHGE